MSDESSKTLTLAELPELRRKTEAVSRFLREQIVAHLETLRPLFAAERILGKHAGGKVEVQGSDKVLSDLQQSYKPFTRKPYDLPESLDNSWLGLVGNALELYPWEYVHSVQGKPITITAPERWVINYRSNYTLAQLKTALEGKQAARPEYVRQFVVNALVLQSILQRSPGLVKLFDDMRYEVKTETAPEVKGLSMVTITSHLTTFRPADDILAAATAFSGVPAFIELIDLEVAAAPRDALKEKLDELLK